MVRSSAPLRTHKEKGRRGRGRSIRLVSAYDCAPVPLIYAFSHINCLIPMEGQPLWIPCQAGEGGALALLTMTRGWETCWKTWAESENSLFSHIAEHSYDLSWTHPLALYGTTLFFPFPLTVFHLIIQMQRGEKGWIITPSSLVLG